MNVDWFFGPQKTAFVPTDESEVGGDTGVPFHGIVSRGMLDLLATEGVSPESWLKNAHLLFRPRRDHLGATTRDLEVLRACAAESKALSFKESAACVELYLEQFCVPAGTARGLSAWNVKEGHTSSVWKVSWLAEDDEEVECVINVARDRMANSELETTTRRMQQIGVGCPGINMAAVQDVQIVHLCREQEQIDVVVTRNDWVKNSYEIHAVHDAGGRVRQYLLVERFLTTPERPAHIVSIQGRRFDESECQRIESDMARFLARASEVVASPALNVNEGDLVWDGLGAIVVAMSGPNQELSNAAIRGQASQQRSEL